MKTKTKQSNIKNKKLITKLKNNNQAIVLKKNKFVIIDKCKIEIIEKSSTIRMEIEKKAVVSINGKVVRFYYYNKDDGMNCPEFDVDPHNADIQQLTEEENEILQEYMVDFDWSN